MFLNSQSILFLLLIWNKLESIVLGDCKLIRAFAFHLEECVCRQNAYVFVYNAYMHLYVIL